MLSDCRVQLILLACVALSTVLGYRWPSPQYDALESFLYEGRRYDGSNMASLQHPCKTRSGTQASIGAEWLRLAYHDTATHNAADGTGGLDGSIAFELGRDENIGSGMNVSLQDFKSFSNKYISRSDVIAMATVFAVASCGGPIVPFRGGRIDALQAGPLGVPEPQQDLATHAELFRRQGFTQEEMITLVACGHTLGGVRSRDFPAIVPPGSDESKVIFENFDNSTQFDNSIVLQYLDGTTANPLVVDVNQTVRSDLRIFSSDNNVTMHRLSSSDAYTRSCLTILERMINMVPSNVTLTDEVALLHAKVFKVQLTLERNRLVFKASLRLTQSTNTTVSDNRTVKMLWCDRRGDAQGCSDGRFKTASPAARNQDDPNISPVTLRLGYYFLNYNFVVPVDSTVSISKFWFEVDEYNGTSPILYDNGGTGYEIAQDTVLYVPTLSSVSLSGINDSISTYHLVAAVRNDTVPSRVYMTVFDSAIPNFLPPLNASIDLKLNRTLNSVEGYNFYSGSIEDKGLQMTVDMHSISDSTTYTEDFMQTFSLDIGTPFTPPTPVETTSADLPNVTSTSSSSSSPRTFIYELQKGGILCISLILVTSALVTLLS